MLAEQLTPLARQVRLAAEGLRRCAPGTGLAARGVDLMQLELDHVARGGRLRRHEDAQDDGLVGVDHHVVEADDRPDVDRGAERAADVDLTGVGLHLDPEVHRQRRVVAESPPHDVVDAHGLAAGVGDADDDADLVGDRTGGADGIDPLGDRDLPAVRDGRVVWAVDLVVDAAGHDGQEERERASERTF